MGTSLLARLRELPREQQVEWLEGLPSAVAQQIAAQPWWLIGRPEQQKPEGDWNVWLILSGRGWGKTRTGAETMLEDILAQPAAPDGAPTEWAIVAQTFADCRVMCVEGPSGILRSMERIGLKPGEDYIYNRSAWQILFKTGQKLHMFGADDKDAGRGFNLAGVWADEIAKWRYSYETWHEGIAPALRIGDHPRAIVTTTPKPIKILKEWISRDDGSVVVTRGSTFDNAENLSEAALTELQARYAGTRVGRQELFGELLEDVEGALWTQTMIDDNRTATYPNLARIVVAIDPAVTSGEESDETGIVVAGMAADGHYYILADRTLKASPDTWAKQAVAAYREFGADRVVAETNNGGDMVISLLRQVDPSLPVTKVTATRGKQLRAEPVSSLYEQGRVHHVGSFEALETQLCEWTPLSGSSPDRLDALVWAITELSQSGNAMLSLAALARFCPGCQMPAPKSATVCPKCNTPMGG